MILIDQLLEKRISELKKLIKIIENRIDKYPSGKLRISSNGNYVSYFYRKNDLKEIYIKNSEIKLAELLAQKDYDERILKYAKDEVVKIQKFINNYNPRREIEIFDSLNNKRQALVNPLVCNDLRLVDLWNNTSYEKKAIRDGSITFKTEKNEYVRSKSEKIIADKLFNKGIPYHYEYPVYLKDIGIVHPDFRILNIRTRKVYLWEHFGMMDDPSYSEKSIKKINSYAKNGYFSGENIIYSYETRNNFDIDVINKLINKYLV